MSRREFKTRQHLVGWDGGLPTFFGQVWSLPDGDDTDCPPEPWVGTPWEELPTPEALAEALGAYATIAQRLSPAWGRLCDIGWPIATGFDCPAGQWVASAALGAPMGAAQ